MNTNDVLTKLIAEIDKLLAKAKNDEEKAFVKKDAVGHLVAVTKTAVCVKIKKLITSLQQEQPEVYLNENTMKKEFRMIDSACLLFNYDKLIREQLIARRFYQLGLKAK